jgi:hypothetical protein
MIKFILLSILISSCSNLDIFKSKSEVKKELFKKHYADLENSYSKIDNKLKSSKVIFKTPYPLKCFNKNKQQMNTNIKECKDSVNVCSGYGFRFKNNTLSTYLLESGFNINIIKYSDSEDLTNQFNKFFKKEDLDDQFKDSINDIHKSAYNLCYLAGLSGIDIGNGLFVTGSFYKYLNSLESKKVEEAFVEVAKGYEEMQDNKLSNEKVFEVVSEMYSGLSKDLCKHARIIKGNTVYSYQTEGCEIRDVTLEDLEDDIERWKDNQFITKATILNHELLRDKVKTCSKAIKEFNIKYVPINLSKDCKD